MSRKVDSIWYRLGWLIEEVMASLPPRPGERRSPKSAKRAGRRRTPAGSEEGTSDLLVGIGSTLAATLLARWVAKRRFPLWRLTRGALAGAGAAGVILALRMLRRQDDDHGRTLEEVGDELLAGAGKGVLYAALLEPFLPGPSILRGALAGSADYLASPMGGLFSSLQPYSPVRRFPILPILFETGEVEDDPYLTFLLHGTILGLLYGSPHTRED